MKLSERFEPKGSLLQCHNCQEYGHMYKSCSSPTRCATCSGNHSTRNHEEQAPKAGEACAACNKSGHPTCPIRMKERHRATQRKSQHGPIIWNPKRKAQDTRKRRRRIHNSPKQKEKSRRGISENRGSNFDPRITAEPSPIQSEKQTRSNNNEKTRQAAETASQRGGSKDSSSGNSLSSGYFQRQRTNNRY